MGGRLSWNFYVKGGVKERKREQSHPDKATGKVHVAHVCASAFRSTSHPEMNHPFLLRTLLDVLLLGATLADAHAQAYGLTSRPSVGAYLDGVMPPEPPALSLIEVTDIIEGVVKRFYHLRITN